jgi:hypothetical protein
MNEREGAMNEVAVEALVRRLERVERENRRLKRIGFAVLAGITALVLMGQAKPDKVAEVVEAEKFVLREPSGKLRASLGVGADGVASLSLTDRAEKPHAVLAASRDGSAALIFYDKDGKSIFRAP